MSDIEMPSAREHGLYDLRRKRAAVAMFVVGAASVVPGLLLGDMAMIALPATALFAYLAIPSWIGAAPRFPRASAGAALFEGLSMSIVPFVGMMLMFFMLNRGDLRILVSAPSLIAGAVSFGVYRWHYRGLALNTVRGERAGMSLGGRLWRHYLGYVLGLSSATVGMLVARAVVPDTSAMLAHIVFLPIFMSVKTVVDVSLPQPPLAAQRLSRAAGQLALMSPVWFGLPWGVTILGLSVSVSRGQIPLMWVIERDAVVVVYMTLASVVVFTAFALTTYLLEVITGEG
jgi:hypothetical protein